MAIPLALLASFGWGAGDFFGGASRRQTPVFVVLAVSQAIGLALLVPVMIAHGAAPPGDPRLLFAGLAGLGVTVELRLVYLALSEGDAFITAPVGALGATMAAVVGLISGDRLDLVIAGGMACALAGGGLSARDPARDGRRRTHTSALRKAGVCLGAATGVSIALVALHASGRVDPYWAATVVDVGTLVPAAIAAGATERRPLRRRLPTQSQLPGLALGAAGGVAGDLAYAAASRGGALSIVSALSALYPLTTVGLGIALQGRRPTLLQGIGVVLALTGAGLLGATR
jgi:drug/metabolite transporter (DMT)-like permease